MTEVEWLAATDVAGMIQHLRVTNATERKYRLFALEYVRIIRRYLEDEGSIRALDFVETNTEKPFKGLRGIRSIRTAAMMAASVPLPTGQRTDAWSVALRAAHAASCLLDQGWIAALHCSHQTAEAIFSVASDSFDPMSDLSQPNHAHLARTHELHLHCEWLRDIFGNPFRPVTFSPSWRTDTAVAIAKQMYESRDFSAMPILADALQDAGCDSADILDPCRGPGPHVRGCWVVDLVLEKK